jgi:hypothetical protein
MSESLVRDLPVVIHQCIIEQLQTLQSIELRDYVDDAYKLKPNEKPLSFVDFDRLSPLQGQANTGGYYTLGNVIVFCYGATATEALYTVSRLFMDVDSTLSGLYDDVLGWQLAFLEDRMTIESRAFLEQATVKVSAMQKKMVMPFIVNFTVPRMDGAPTGPHSNFRNGSLL